MVKGSGVLNRLLPPFTTAAFDSRRFLRLQVRDDLVDLLTVQGPLDPQHNRQRHHDIAISLFSRIFILREVGGTAALDLYFGRTDSKPTPRSPHAVPRCISLIAFHNLDRHAEVDQPRLQQR
jgi:hypothetical protein